MKKTTIKDFIGIFVLTIYFAELIFPFVNTIGSQVTIKLVCFIIWIFIAFLIDPNYFKKTYVIFPLLTYILLTITGYFWGYAVIGNRYLSLSLVICGSVIYNFYLTHDKLFQLRKVLTITAILATITFINTYLALLDNPYISRSIKSSGEYSELLAKQGIGGYTFIYFIAAISICFLFLGLVEKNKMKKLLYIALYVICLFFLVKSNYTTALLTVLICSLVLYVGKSSSSWKESLMKILFILISSVLILTFGDKIIYFLKEILPNRILAAFFSHTNTSIVASIFQEFVLDRWPVMLQSIESLFDFPIFGIVGGGNIKYDGEFLTGFGQHSYILDTFALFGLSLGLLALNNLKMPFTYPAISTKKTKSLTVSMVICMFILYLVNNATESIALVMCMFYPYIRDKHEKEMK